ncbi:lipase maturation factor family protein [Bowmanella dokdonensis]|uniref:Lipase maturation factor family protein n=1 Tax=Bowmanella dokdonensis TaxID=751969 RepID=A0A939ISA9_9ALTE|nr:lipase maturation factor family protein [Bowmanella dokdonensis]MBN7826231.1 lipase maturation factor family protein [Bowmanella dokdonensis]
MKQQSLLVYDGDCRFCRSWVRYWAHETGDLIRFRPYQEVACDFPELNEAQFRNHIQFFDEQGQRYQGAAAAFQVQKRIPGKGGWWWLYNNIPGFAPLSEGIYDWVARHRGAAYTGQKLLWGESLHRDQYQKVSWLFLRLLALVYFCAFLSFFSQSQGLIGSNGLLPLTEFMDQVRQQLGGSAYWRLPMLFWWDASDSTIRWLCLGGMLVSLLLLFNCLARLSLILLYLAYLSLVHAGQDFMLYQWDLLLLEAGFLAIFLGKGNLPVVWLYRFLLFRFVFFSGLAKLQSGDPAWGGLTALEFYFQTQPLPTSFAWYAHQLPDWCLQAMTLMVLSLELLLPWLFFLPRKPRKAAAVLFMLFQAAILATGNYNFFNLLSLVLCLFLFDDRALRWWMPSFIGHERLSARRWRRQGLAVFSCLLLILGLLQCWSSISRQPPTWVYSLQDLAAPWRVVNAYGLFAVVTRQRIEIIIEGSHDGREWRPYPLPAKPGDPASPPDWILPHQPRLDWQLWFAALEGQPPPAWFRTLMISLLFNNQDALGLFKHNPFAERRPQFVRARLFIYEFTDFAEKADSGRWWKRREAGVYFPASYFEISVSEVGK